MPENTGIYEGPLNVQSNVESTASSSVAKVGGPTAQITAFHNMINQKDGLNQN